MSTDSSSRLAGYALAHAAWTMAQAGPAERLAPFVIVDEAGERELTRFEEPTQDAAVDEGKRAVARLAGRVDAWAFAREALLRTRGSDAAQHVIVVEFGARGEDEGHTAIQPYGRAGAAHGLRLIGDPLILRANAVADAEETEAIRGSLRGGFRDHTAVPDLWAE